MPLGLQPWLGVQPSTLLRSSPRTFFARLHALARRLTTVKTLQVEAAPGRFELLALTKLRTPPGLRGKQPPAEAEAMPPPTSYSADAAAMPPPSRPSISQLHRVRLAWTDTAGAARVLGPLPAFYLGAALAIRWGDTPASPDQG